MLDTLIRRTGSKRIAESAADRLWGSGRSLGDPLCLDTFNWISQGLLGQILENIRDEFVQTMPPMQEPTIQPSVFSPMTYGPIPNFTANPNPLPTPMNNHTASEPVPIPQHHCSNQDPTVEMTITDESSATSTPVSDTTATDTDGTNVSTSHHNVAKQI